MLRQLRRDHFGRKSERLSEDQLNLALEDLETAIASGEAAVEKADATLTASRRKARRANRGHFRRICRARRSSSSQRARHAPAVGAICMSSARIVPSVSTRSRPNTA